MFWVYHDDYDTTKHESLALALREAAGHGGGYVGDLERDVFINLHELDPRPTWRVSFVSGETGPSAALSWTTEELLSWWPGLDSLVTYRGCPTPDCGDDLWPMMRMPAGYDTSPGADNVLRVRYAYQCHRCLGWVMGVSRPPVVVEPYKRTRRDPGLT